MTRLKRRISLVALLFAIILMTIAVPVSAAIAYRASIAVVESNGTAYAMLPVVTSIDNTFLAANGFITASALDTRVGTLGGQYKPWLVADDKTLFATAIPADSQTNLYLTTANTAAATMSLITGYNGYITVVDDPDLEPTNNFTFTDRLYYDTSTVGKTVVFKNGAFIITTRTANNVDAAILAAEAGKDIGGAASLGSSPVYGSQWRGNSMTAGSSYYLTSVTITSVANTGVPPVANGINVYIRTTPTGTNIATATNTAWVAGGANTFTLNTPVYIANGSTYYIILNFPSGDVGNCINWAYDNPGAGGGYTVSADSGASWAPNPAFDFVCSTSGCAISCSAIVNGITPQEVIVVAEADTVNLVLYVYDTTPALLGSTTTALGGASVPNNANNWLYGLNTSAPYFTYIKESVAGVEKLWYEPTTMIIGTAVVDRQGGDENGVITWGANPAGIAVTNGSLVSTSQSVPGAVTDRPTKDVTGEAGGSDWIAEPDVAGALLTHPLRPLITVVSDNTTLTESQVWLWSGICFVFLILMLSIRYLSSHKLMVGIALAVAIITLVVQSVFPIWSIAIAVLAIAAGVIAERSQSI